jgi:ABC-type sugar transport system substrate-binding protein
MWKTTGWRARRWRVLAGGMVLAALLPACSAAGQGATAQGGQADVPASYPTASAAQLHQVAVTAINPNLDLSGLAPEVKTALESAATPLTPAQQKIWLRCIAAPICDTGQGTKTVALVEDQQQEYYSISAGEFDAEAIQSGQVRKIIHTSTNSDLSQYLSNFRQAIAQKPSFIVSEFAAFGSEAVPVVAQAKAAGIPVINAATQVSPTLAKLLGVELRAAPCDMWSRAAPLLTQHLKQQGITHPTYALFSGPPGNTYAAAWQPCAQQDVANLGWTKVYTGYNVWTPQGQAQAASALLASGKNPDVILTDIAPQQFLQSYMQAGKKLPLIMIGGGFDVNALKAYLQAQKAGANPDIWASSSQVWMNRVAVVAGLELANGHKPSSNPIMYPLSAEPLSDIVKTHDLNVDGNAIVGTLLSPAQQNQSLKY